MAGKPINKEKLLAALRKQYPDKKILVEPQDRVLLFWPEVDQILQALGYGHALVTDASKFSHFDLNEEELDAAMRPLGLDKFITHDTTIIEAAMLLRQMGRPL